MASIIRHREYSFADEYSFLATRHESEWQYERQRVLDNTIYVRCLARRSVRKWHWPYILRRGGLELRMVSRSDDSASPPPSSSAGAETVGAQSTVTTSIHPSDSASQVRAKRAKKLVQPLLMVCVAGDAGASWEEEYASA